VFRIISVRIYRAEVIITRYAALNNAPHEETLMPRPKKQTDAPQQTNGTPDTAQPDAVTNGQEGVRRVNKMQMVRKALKKLGNDAKPLRIQAYLKKWHGLEISADMISNYKGSILRKARGESGPAQEPEAAAPIALKEQASGGGIRIEEVRAVKKLADRLGAGKVRELVDVLYQ
jgi:hypothetical protein